MNQNPMENEPLLDNAVKEDIKKPQRYKVILHNDDYTTMDFVVDIIVNVFKKPLDEAAVIMFSIHEKGSGVCGLYPHEIAEIRVNQTIYLAREAGFPLLCTMEKE